MAPTQSDAIHELRAAFHSHFRGEFFKPPGSWTWRNWKFGQKRERKMVWLNVEQC